MKVTSEERYNDLLTRLDMWLDPGVYHNLFHLLSHYESQIKTCPGSIHYHHCEEGGWLRHTLEVVTLATRIVGEFETMCSKENSITNGDILLAGLLHDFAKLVSYRQTYDLSDPSKTLHWTKVEDRWKYLSPEVWTIRECERYGVHLSDEVVNALLMAEGGWSAFARSSTHSNRSGGVQSPLAAVIHAADLVSATLG